MEKRRIKAMERLDAEHEKKRRAPVIALYNAIQVVADREIWLRVIHFNPVRENMNG